MDRFFCRRALAAALLALVLLPAGAEPQVQPVFFSMLFPQLMPGAERLDEKKEAWFRRVPCWRWLVDNEQEGVSL